ncbi:glycosyltransferase family 4 protein [Tabrizicola sp. J26]|uniref:glycosyltransferase family 4 protein n=1 Tax=Alitabrizicola rongguiensis TaxID=2909234 RepID=UPI001F274770|nr:glycosyltransferase family 4 protein [Tabrizicola rongguiensis]MCF1707619.1 glycosyltransferase family 4 protein [Tabrizicola rongguiensis]
MKILFIHQNFPGQFLHLAPELARRGHDCLVLTDAVNNRPAGIPFVKYRYTPPPVDPKETRLGRNYTTMSDRGVAVARAARTLRDERGYEPDLILGHSGWGETLFLKEIWPRARLVIYAEFYYRGQGLDMGFDPEFAATSLDGLMIAQSRAAHLGQALVHADAGIAPTEWQASTFPPVLRQMLTVLHDGIDTDLVRPDPNARLELPHGRVLTATDEVVSFVNRNLEPYRGWHVFARALPEVLRARPEAQVVIVGGDGVSYGQPPADGGSWKDALLREVGPGLDLARVHFLGRVPHDSFVRLMQVTRVHAYLTYPFVLSWSLLEAMSAGALVIGSKTPPVEEVIRDGVNGVLVDFFDTAAWSAALIAALSEPDRYRAIQAAARSSVVERYDLRRRCLPRLVSYIEAQGAVPPVR